MLRDIIIRETSVDPGVELQPLSALFTMAAASRDNALQLSTSKDAQERRIIDDHIWEIGGGGKFTSLSKSQVSDQNCIVSNKLFVSLIMTNLMVVIVIMMMTDILKFQ